jgi:hypothetical protein
MQHQNQRKHIGRGRISRPAPRISKGPVNPLLEIQGVKKFPEQDPPRLRGHRVIGGFEIEGMNV